MKKTSMFKKFFTTISAPIMKAAANVWVSILPKNAYLKYMRKNDSEGIFKDISDEVLLQSRMAVRIQTAIKAVVMTIGMFLGMAIYKKCHA